MTKKNTTLPAGFDVVAATRTASAYIEAHTLDSDSKAIIRGLAAEFDSIADPRTRTRGPVTVLALMDLVTMGGLHRVEENTAAFTALVEQGVLVVSNGNVTWAL